MRHLIGLSIVLASAAGSFGQYPGYGGYGNAGIPGLYGGGLSPYLNLRSRNVNSAINYFNFTRPYTGGTFGNAFVSPYMGGSPSGTPGASRFFPEQVPFYADAEPARQRVDDKAKPDKDGLRPVEMPPAGHGGGFMNTMGHFGSPSGLQGGGRPAASLGRPRGR